MSAIACITIVVTILYLHPPNCSTSFIHATVPGLLTFSRLIHLNMVVEDLHGVILYIVDSERNQLGIEVIEGGDAERLVQIMSNKRYDTTDTDFSITCNSGYDHHQTSISHRMNNRVNHLVDAGVRYPVPLSVANGANATFIAIGNIGPMVDESHRTVAPLAQQIIGCLKDFSFGSDELEFIEEGSALRRSCPESCDNNTCNGGRCRPLYRGDSIGQYYRILRRHRILDRYRILHSRPMCDCSSTALNGLYCNKALRRYRRDGDNTYTMDRRASLKMSWEVSSPGRYCLLEVMRGGESMTLVIEGDHLTANSATISRVDARDADFVHIDIRYDHYVVKTKYSESNISSSLGDAPLVYIGFSERSADCRTLEGSYDLVVDSRYPIKRSRARAFHSIRWSFKAALLIFGISILLLVALTIIVTVVRNRMRERTNGLDENVYEAEVVGMDSRCLQKRRREDPSNRPSTSQGTAT